MNIDNFIVHMKTDNIYKYIAEDVETRFYTSSYELDRPLLKGKNVKVIYLKKDELGGKIMKKFVGIRAKTYSYLIYDGSEDKKAKGRKKCIIKRKIKYENYKNCLEVTEKNEVSVDTLKKNHKNFIRNNKLILKTQQRFKSERHDVFTEGINKIVLCSNDDKRMQSIDSIETYACRTSKDLVTEKEEIKCNNITK